MSLAASSANDASSHLLLAGNGSPDERCMAKTSAARLAT